MLGSNFIPLIINNTKKYNFFTTSNTPIGNYNLDHKIHDLTKSNFDELLNWCKPEVIIHCAANTNLENCEKDIDNALKINANPLKYFSKSKFVKRIIYISTDSVYGKIIGQASESSKTIPINNYGKTKLCGEEFLINSNKKFTVLRATPVGFNLLKKNNTHFVQWMLQKASKKQKIKLYQNVIFSPISCNFLIQEIFHCIKHKIDGIFNITGEFSFSKYDFGKILINLFEFDEELIEKSNYVSCTDTKRSLNQTLNSNKYFSENLRQPETLDQLKLSLFKAHKTILKIN